MKGGGGPQSGGNILQGGGTGGAIIPLGVLGPVNSNGENGVRKTHRILDTNHGEAGAAEGRRYVVYTIRKGSEGSGGNLLGNNLHRTKTGESGTMGGTADDIQGLRKGKGLLGEKE